MIAPHIRALHKGRRHLEHELRIALSSFRVLSRVATAILLLLLLSVTAAAAGNSLRCQGRLVEIGDSPNKVREACGEPQHIQSEEIYPDTWISRYYDDEHERYHAPYLIQGPIRLEIWTYDFGSNRLPYYLHFENKRLLRIASGRRNP